MVGDYVGLKHNLFSEVSNHQIDTQMITSYNLVQFSTRKKQTNKQDKHITKHKTPRNRTIKKLKENKQVGDYVRVSQTVGDYVRVSPTVGDYVRVSQTVGDYVRVSQTVVDYVRVSQTVVDYVRVPQTVGDYVRVSQTVGDC